LLQCGDLLLGLKICGLLERFVCWLELAVVDGGVNSGLELLRSLQERTVRFVIRLVREAVFGFCIRKSWLGLLWLVSKAVRLRQS
jgi:hypothetical protein